MRCYSGPRYHVCGRGAMYTTEFRNPVLEMKKMTKVLPNGPV